jgi:FHS family glucose/mannose:H+ symporter-like MFS transporter
MAKTAEFPVAPAGTRRGLSGFLLAGLAFALPGAILPAWGFHYSSGYLEAASFFAVLNGGILLARQFGRGWIQRTSPRISLPVSAALIAGALLALVFAAPPTPAWARLVSLLSLGFGAGLLYATCFYLVAPAFDRAPAATANFVSILFCLGSITASLGVAGSIEGYQLWLPVALFGALSAGFAYWYSRPGLPAQMTPPPKAAASAGVPDTGAILMALVLFFQFGNEWSIAAWLPLLLIQRLGMSPQAALLMLTLYWVALMLGRLLAQPVLARVPHSRVLAASAISVVFACLLLGVTGSRGGAAVAVILAGGGFSVIYPLLLEMTGRRYANDHPVNFHGIFTLALTGGMLAPGAFGLMAQFGGLGLAMLIPFFGSCMVFVLLVLIRIESGLDRAK